MQEFATGKVPALGRALYQLTCYVFKNRQAARIMKLTSILLLAGCLQLSAKGITQTVSITVKDAPLLTVLKAIEKQTNYVFFVNNQQLQKAKKVTVTANNLPLQQVLDLCFKDQPLTYIILGKVINVIPRPGEKASLSISKDVSYIDVKGRVVDSKGDPVANATVSVQGLNKTTLTNANGEFSLAGISEDAVIVITHVQYETANLSLNGHSIVNATLQIKISSLDEMQVIAYGTTTKRLNTGNVSSVKASDIEKQPVNNPLLALQGRVPGMVITQVNGLAGGGVQVQIRGQNSIANGNLPLYIIDGVPYTNENLPNLGRSILGSSSNSGDRAGNPLSLINVADIESIDVLKDADATAIYGTRGANGVILVTTKKGKAGKVKVGVNFQSGFGKVPEKIQLLDTRQYLDMRYEAFRNDGITSIPTSNYDLKLWDTTRYTDWQQELIGGTANYNDAQVSLSGGNNNVSYLVGAGYHKEKTVFPGDFNNQRTSLHFNLNSTSTNQKFNFFLSTNYSVNNNRLLQTDFTSLAVNLAPNAPALYNSDGTLNWALRTPGGASSWTNPLASLNNRYKNKTDNLISNAVLSYKIIKGLEVKASLGYTNMQTNEVTTNPSTAKDPTQNWGNILRSSSFMDNKIRSWIIEPQAIYSNNIWGGFFSVLVGTTIQQNESSSLRLNAEGFNSDLILEDAKSAPITSVGGSLYSLYKYNAIFGRLSYNWREKYLFNLTARRDGTSRFGPEARFHNFGAAGIGWIFSKEGFFGNNLKFLSFGKLRGSYGTTGSDAVGDYSFLDLYSPTGVDVPYQGATGLQLTQLFNPDLAWEETKKVEAAIELGFFRDRVFINVSHYHNKSSNQLVGYALPSTAGYLSVNKNLDALIRNEGWEFSLSTVNLNKKDFRWTSTFNIFWNRNKLVSADTNMLVYRPYIGRSLNSFYVFKLGGVNSSTGLYQFIDNHGNIVRLPDAVNDRIVLIEPTPKFSGGFLNSIQFKGFQLDFFFHFVKQVGQDYLYSGVRPGSFSSLTGNQPITVLDRWQKPGDEVNIQKFSQNSASSAPFARARTSDQLFKDLSFIRLKNVSISWQLPAKWKKTVMLQDCRLYAQGQNLLTFTKYKGFDPETKSATSIPPLRVLTVGIQLTF